MKIKDSNLILTMKTKKKRSQFIINALMLSHNKDRYIFSDISDDIESREIIFYSNLDKDNNATETEKIHQLRLIFDRTLKDIEKEFLFDIDKQVCDVLLATKRRQNNISEIHFYITFDEKECFVLFDIST